MRTRWLLVVSIVVWVAYEYGRENLKSLLLTKGIQMHLKVALAAGVCVGILSMPSLDSLLDNNRGLADYLRLCLQQGPATSSEVNQRVWSGISMAGGEGEAVSSKDYEVQYQQQGGGEEERTVDQAQGSAVAPQQPAMNDTLRRKIAASQSWKCDICRKPLRADFVVDADGACCATCDRHSATAKRKHMVYFS